MDFQECIKFASENPVCFMATTDGAQPRVRGMLMFFANEDGFYFGTLLPKHLTKQLKDNPKIEICFYNNPSELADAKSMRVTGEIEWLDDEALTGRIAKERDFLDQFAGKPLRDLWRVFRIHTGEAHFWTIPDVLKEQQLERIHF